MTVDGTDETLGYQLIEPGSLSPPAPAKHPAYAEVLRWIVARLEVSLGERLDGIRLSVISANYHGEYPAIAAQYLVDAPDISDTIEALVDKWVAGTELGSFLDFLSQDTK